MRVFLFIIVVFITSFYNTQTKIKGVWQGVLLKDGQKESDALVFYVQFSEEGKNLIGKTRSEIYNTDLYAIQKIKGAQNGNEIVFKEFVIESKKTNSKTTWCSSDFTGKYIDSSAYIEGTFKSSTCKRNTGKFILYRSKSIFSETKDASLGHAWRDVFLNDIKLKRKAPEIRDKEMANFDFQSVYFDYDEAEIKLEYHNYLKKMIEIVNGHSDLRIQIIGHTDADGTYKYNDDLSKKRAKAIEDFFKQNGLDLKKLKIDFKGELEPIDSNNTDEGKKRNRRVDFKFIYN